MIQNLLQRKNSFFWVFVPLVLSIMGLCYSHLSLAQKPLQKRQRATIFRPTPRFPIFRKLSLPSKPKPSKIKLLYPGITIEHLTTQEHTLLRPDLPKGRFSLTQRQKFTHFLRCHHTGKSKPIDARLLALLYQISHHYQNKKITVIAGYRAPEVAFKKGNPNSPHTKGVACDFRLAGISVEKLRDYVRNTYQHIGLGYYPHSRFIHVDVGRHRSAFWVDASGPGQRAQYTTLAKNTIERKGYLMPWKR